MDTGVVFSSLLLGIFQGLSEFLPVSSSGHLVLLPWLFDFPDPNITAGERTVTTVPLQQLFVLNSDFMVSQSRAFAARLQKDAATDEARINLAFGLLFGRQPTADERAAAVEFLGVPATADGDKLSLLEQYCLALLGTNEFAFVD